MAQTNGQGWEISWLKLRSRLTYPALQGSGRDQAPAGAGRVQPANSIRRVAFDVKPLSLSSEGAP